MLRERPAEPRESDGSNCAQVTELTVRMLSAAARYGIGTPSCLEKSLALRWLLAKQGIATDLRIGVRKAGGKFEAHAWVEKGGRVLVSDFDAEHQHYAAFDASFSALPPERT